MPKLKKAILPIGEYLVSTADGGRTAKKFSESYLREVSENANKMVLAGLRIPAPFKHLKEALPTEKVDTDSYANAGYWESFQIESIKGIPTLVGIIDAPGTAEDMNTPAGKLTHTIKEVSACIKDSWTDGKGRNWGPCILHGAPVLHPIVPGQDGFALLEDSVALSVLDIVSEPTQADLAQLSTELSKSGIYVPPDTMINDLPKILITVLKQKQLSETVENDDHEIVESTSVFMSLPEGLKMKVTKSVAETMIALGAVNPGTKKAYTMEDFEIQKDQVETYALAVTDELRESKKRDLLGRVNAVVASGRTSKEFAESKIIPQIATYQLSLGDGAKFVPNNVDMMVEALEALPAPTVAPANHNATMPQGSTIHLLSEYDDTDDTLTADQVKDLQKTLLANMI